MSIKLVKGEIIEILAFLSKSRNYASELVEKLDSKYIQHYLRKDKNEENEAEIRLRFIELYCAIRDLKEYSDFE